jgi:hypothetical protein
MEKEEARNFFLWDIHVISDWNSKASQPTRETDL